MLQMFSSSEKRKNEDIIERRNCILPTEKVLCDEVLKQNKQKLKMGGGFFLLYVTYVYLCPFLIKEA